MILHIVAATDTNALRAVWSQQELRRNALLDWRFSDEDAQTMRSLIEARRLARRAYASPL